MRATRHTVTVVLGTLLALLAGVTFAASAGAATRPDAIVIGDSLTYYGKPNLAASRPEWIIDGVRGRPVSALPSRIRANVRAHGVPRHLVLALGQNASEGWTRADYRHAARMVPQRTQVYFVTTYRDPAVFGQDAADQQETYSRWMRNIAAHLANVHVLDWRQLVLDGTAVLEDGSHADEASRQVWADLIDQGVAEVTAQLLAAQAG